MVQDLRKLMKLHRRHSLRQLGRPERSLAEHHTLMAALAARDGERAAACMRARIRAGLSAAG